jgi:Predicted permease, DMT superfamily
MAVLLFAHISVLGVAWLRIATAAVVFLVWRRPLRTIRRATSEQRLVMLALGVILAAMNCMFYLATDRLPLSTVGAIEFLGVIALAALGTHSLRNLTALGLAVAGVAILTDVRWESEPWGFAFAFANCAGFMVYVMLGHRVATTGSASDGTPGLSGIDQLAVAMVVAAVVVTPVGITDAATAFAHPTWLIWGAGVGICSSVIPYVTDQLAMARLPRATFAFLLCLLPASATVIGLVVLHQVPGWRDLVGVGAVAAALALRREVRS